MTSNKDKISTELKEEEFTGLNLVHFTSEIQVITTGKENLFTDRGISLGLTERSNQSTFCQML